MNLDRIKEHLELEIVVERPHVDHTATWVVHVAVQAEREVVDLTRDEVLELLEVLRALDVLLVDVDVCLNLGEELLVGHLQPCAFENVPGVVVQCVRGGAGGLCTLESEHAVTRHPVDGVDVDVL